MRQNIFNFDNEQNTAQPAWLSQIDAKASQILSKQYSTIATQTYGLFYTSSKSLENKSEKEGKLLKQDKEFFEKKPVLTAVSAGRGKFIYFIN